MKKLFFAGALSALLLVACSEEETQKEVEEVETEVNEEVEEESSSAQKATIDAFKSNDFMTFANAFYGLEGPERSDVYRSTVEGATTTWTGIITDLETIKDSIVMVGKTDSYNGEDWISLQKDSSDLVPYVIIVEMNDPNVKANLNKGDTITLQGEIGARGDLDLKYNWKLYKGEIVK